ncbi:MULTISPECIES: hypothetical protein [Streptomyces]|uniref:hypothetical protein n=1 Tax=Streptomyces TaxID=1883 RepID=UPI002930729F|nr:hypothetical protein [Streptomyces sp. NEAU-HV9]
MVVDGRQLAFPGRVLQDRDQEYEPVVDGVAVPESLDRGHPARVGGSTGGE